MMHKTMLACWLAEGDSVAQFEEQSIGLILIGLDHVQLFDVS